MKRVLLLLCASSLAGCTVDDALSPLPPPKTAPSRSTSIAMSPDGSRLWVVHPDADSVSAIDVKARAVAAEVFLEGKAPSVDAASGRFDPRVAPRALALTKTGARVFVTGQRSGMLYAIDAASATVVGRAHVCSEPVGVLVAPDDASVFVACSQDDSVVELDASSLTVIATAPCPHKPWALAFAHDHKTLLATHLLGPGVSAFATKPLALASTWTVPDLVLPKESDPTTPQGQVRGLYDVAARPGSDELWTTHLMLGTATPQPTLGFLSTVFPTISVLDAKGAPKARMTVSANPGDGGAFGDIVSGPRAITFSPDGALAFVVDTDSEDVLVVDAERKIEVGLARPLPGHMPDGLAFYDGKLYVNERNSEDVAVLDVEPTAAGVTLTLDGPAIQAIAADPMPAELRLGQKLFYSANSDDVAMTQNHWVACASCHVEGRSDAVTWLFEQGPRDTPTNAGGMLDTGFLFRTADRTQVEDYWKTINVEQGGHFSLDEPSQKPLLQALAKYVNFAIAAPVPPTTDPLLVQRGADVFKASGCSTCHSGPALTDSGAANPSLDLQGAVLLHDVGTCVTSGPFPDVAHDDKLGNKRLACAFDTPALRGLWDSVPYFHDGSAATLADTLPKMLAASIGPNGSAPTLSDDEKRALLEYLRSL